MKFNSMKTLVFILAIFSSAMGFAESAQLPTATVNEEILGGDLLLINMKEYLVITGKESQSLEMELGIEGKKQFTHDIVMTKSAGELASLYNSAGSKKTVQTIINRYADVIASMNTKSSLN